MAHTKVHINKWQIYFHYSGCPFWGRILSHSSHAYLWLGHHSDDMWNAKGIYLNNYSTYTGRILAETCPPIFWIPYSDFGHPKIWDFTIEKIGTGHPIVHKIAFWTLHLKASLLKPCILVISIDILLLWF